MRRIFVSNLQIQYHVQWPRYNHLARFTIAVKVLYPTGDTPRLPTETLEWGVPGVHGVTKSGTQFPD